MKKALCGIIYVVGCVVAIDLLICGKDGIVGQRCREIKEAWNNNKPAKEA